MLTSWSEVESALQDEIIKGKIVDYREVLPSHKTRSFRVRKNPGDILGCCTHHNASKTQDPAKTAAYHVGPNHVCSKGCPGILYTFAISQEIEQDKVILCRNLFDITWSQGKKGDEDHEEWSGDENRHLVSILMMGDFDETNRKGKSGNPTVGQMDRWYYLVSWLKQTFDFDNGGLFGHFDFGKYHCPGKMIRGQIEDSRAIVPGLDTDKEWQEALLRWNSSCLPKWGADGIWGNESKRALVDFERAHKHKVDGIQDPFTELLLIKKYGP